MYAPVGSAGADSHHHQGLGCQTINPLVACNGLTGSRVSAQGCPIALTFDLFVGNRTFHYENKGVQLTSLGFVPPCHKTLATLLKGEYGVMKMNFGESVDVPQQYILNAWLGGCGD